MDVVFFEVNAIFRSKENRGKMNVGGTKHPYPVGGLFFFENEKVNELIKFILARVK